MNCKKIQELLLTDYLDNQMNEKEKKSVDDHLAYCRDCARFSIAARKVSSGLFVDVKKSHPPEFIWQRIKESIIAEQKRKTGFAANLFERLKAVLYIPKPAMAVASAITLIVIVGIMAKLIVNSQLAVRAGTQEQSEYSDYSMEIPADVSANGEAIFGTLIEKYFL